MKVAFQVLKKRQGVVPTTFMINYSQLPAQQFDHCLDFYEMKYIGRGMTCISFLCKALFHFNLISISFLPSLLFHYLSYFISF